MKSPKRRIKMKKSLKLVSFVMLMVLILGTLLSACGSTAADDTAVKQSKVDEILARGTLKVGLDFFEPWAFKDKDGNLVGFEVDVATKLAADMGVKIEFVPTAWDGIIPALLTDKFDVIIGGMGTTTERSLKVNFSIPYEYSGVDVVVNKKLLPDVTTMEQLNKADVVIAVHLGTTAADVAKKNAPLATLHQFDTDEAILQDMLNGNAMASFSSSPTPAFWVGDYPDTLYRPFVDYLTSEPSAFVVRKGDSDTIFFFNTWIIKNADWLKERSDYWYGTTQWRSLK
jgi:polar amino acid transport system substrate-binding protein